MSEPTSEPTSKPTSKQGIARRPVAFLVLGLLTLFEALQWYTSYHSRLVAGLQRIPLILFGELVLVVTIMGVAIAELRGYLGDRRAVVAGEVRPPAGRGQVFAGLGVILGLNALWLLLWVK